MGRQWNQIIESLGPLTGGTMSINANLGDIEALLTTLQADVADGITVSSGTVTANVGIASEADVTQFGEWIANGFTAAQPTIAVIGTSGGQPFPVSGTVTAASDKGSVSEASTQSITTGGTHQQVFAANSSRKYLLIQNISDTDMYLGLGFNPSNTTPAGLLLAKSGGGIVFESSYIPTSEVRIVCAAAGKRFVALQG